MTGVRVVAPARLHFGMLDPAGLGRRRFGGFGVGVEAPRVVVDVAPGEPGEELVVSGPQAVRAREFARRAIAAFGVCEPVAVTVREAIPDHRGLGSGTKLGLAIARGLATLAGPSLGDAASDVQRLAAAAGRGARSSVGAWTFAAPGLVLEAGVPDADDDRISPLLCRVDVPESWRCVLVVPTGAAGLSGVAEERFFAGLGGMGAPGGEGGASAVTAAAAAEPSVSRLLLTELLPGLQAGDLEEFGEALATIQRTVGAVFADAQGGIFHPAAAPVVTALEDLGVTAVGQSSWGPSVYGIVAGELRARVVAAELAPRFAGAEVTVVDFDRRGATVTAA